MISREEDAWKDPEALLAAFMKKPAEYKCYAEHIGKKSGFRHYHCYLRTKNPITRTSLVKTFGQNVRFVNGDDYDQEKYIGGQTAGVFWEDGIKKHYSEQAAHVTVDNLLKKGQSLVDIAVENVELRSYINQNKWVLQLVAAEYNKKRAREEIEVPEKLYPWQQHVVDQLSEPVHPRHIYWYMDDDGDQGKSALDDWLFKYKNIVAWMPTGDDQHASEQLDKKTRGVPPENLVIDLSAGEARRISWPTVERAKNGRCERFMFNCDGGYRGKRPRIFVFSNENPTGCPLTANRVKLYRIKDKRIVEETII